MAERMPKNINESFFHGKKFPPENEVILLFRGFYTAASGMIAQQRRTEILTNNLANVSTPGYKADETVLRAFPEMLIQRLENQALPGTANKRLPRLSYVGPLNTGAYVQETIPRFQQGDLEETGFSTDMALVNINMPENEAGFQGTVFFTLENPAGGILYTRNGNFTLDGAGYLTNAYGLYVLDDQGNRIRLDSDRFQVDEDGWIIQDGAPVARIGVAFAENPLALVKREDGNYQWEDGVLPSAYGQGNMSFLVKQNHIERSNVDLAETMTQLLTAYRTFEANQKIVQAYDRSMDKAVNEIGRIG
jgi:flagellar basal-body rod protein FlgF